VLPIRKRPSHQTPPQAHPQKPALTVLKSRRNAKTVVPQPPQRAAEPAHAEQDFISALAELLVADATRPKPRLRIRNRPVERAKPPLVLKVVK
jgi:hypothetical protein